MNYTEMSTTDLKKLLSERKIKGRSYIKTKQQMIVVLREFDQSPEEFKDLVPSGYKAKTYEELKILIEQRNIPNSSKLTPKYANKSVIKNIMADILDLHDSNPQDPEIDRLISWVSTPKQPKK